MIYFTADEHYFHGKAINYCNRPWKDVNTMNNGLIKLHNSVVKKDDMVYHLGDIAMIKKDKIMKLEPILERLNGTHHLILGNHDEGNPFTYVRFGFTSVHTSLILEEFVLIHDPANAVMLPKDQKILCGHLHHVCKWVAPNILNVGVDIYDYKPISIEEIRDEFA